MLRKTPAIVAASCLLAGAITLVLAGPLDPPAGPVAPTYKTLTEVEPRIAINATNTPGDADSLFRIGASGSYYLTGDIVGVDDLNGIMIAADDVALDLMGFRVGGVSGAIRGIRTDAPRRNITIRNGVVAGWSVHGIDLIDGAGASCRIEHVLASHNAGDGIVASSDGRVLACTALANGERGIVVRSSSLIERCVARLNGSHGLDAGDRCLIVECVASGNGQIGVLARFDAIVRSCNAEGNHQDGILVSDRSVVAGCAASGNSRVGIYVVGDHARVEGSLSDLNLYGFSAFSTGGNLFVGNKARGNSDNYLIGAGNCVGTIVGSESAMNAATNENVNWSF